jgi:hypothetical protein
MPIIVDEVVISVEVTNQSSGGSSSTQSQSGDRQSIVNECVEKVLEVLKQKSER